MTLHTAVTTFKPEQDTAVNMTWFRFHYVAMLYIGRYTEICVASGR